MCHYRYVTDIYQVILPRSLMAIVCYELITELDSPPYVVRHWDARVLPSRWGRGYTIAGKLHVAASIYVVCAENAAEFHRALPVPE